MTWIHGTDESTNLCLFTPTCVSSLYLHAVISSSPQVESPKTLWTSERRCDVKDELLILICKTKTTESAPKGSR